MQSLPKVRSILYFTEYCDYFYVGSYLDYYCWLLFTAVLCKRINCLTFAALSEYMGGSPCGKIYFLLP